MTSTRSAPIRILAAALVLAALAAQAAPAGASLPQVRPAEPVTGPLAPPGPPGRIAGFRTAQFGMSEAEVLAALKVDLPGTDGILKTVSNGVERTRLMSAGLPELSPFPGPVQLTYVFGAKSHALIQVNVVWSLPPGASAATESAMAQAARTYAQRMAGYSWHATTTMVGADTSANGVIRLFEAYDERGAQVQLSAAPSADGAGFGELALVFRRNAANPDIFKLKPGDF